MEAGFTRRRFVATAAAASGVAVFGSVASADNDRLPWAGQKIIDCHFHDRPTDAAMLAHLDGAGITSAFVLALSDFRDRMPDLNKKYPGRFLGWGRSSRLAEHNGSGREEAIGSMMATTTDETITALRKEVRAGSTGFAETVGLVEVDGPELQRLYALAADLNVAVMMHFQEGSVPGLPRYGIRGFSRIESMLKKFPKTRFVCHASDFWGNIDANYRDGGAYPEGKMHAGGLSDRLLSDYGNMHGDFGAPSGLIQLSRDPEFTAEFLERHKHKLLFGSDCGCADGKGGSNLPAPFVAPGSSGGGATLMQQRMAAQKGLGGKCIARELLNIAWSSTSRDTFHRLAWVNAHRVYRLGKT